MTSLRALTYLAPSLRRIYAYTCDWVGRALGITIALEDPDDYAEAPQADLCFICGLPYVLAGGTLTALAAPVLHGARYAGRPVYFSDVVVRQSSPYRKFSDLRGAIWAYNEPFSQSGCGITCYMLAQRGETPAFFGRVVQAGFHQLALRGVAAGQFDAAAIDSQVLAVELRDQPELAAQVRVMESFGPSTIQPVAASRRLPVSLQRDVQVALAAMHHDPAARAVLETGFIERYAPVTDADYDDIRAMRATCERAGFTRLD